MRTDEIAPTELDARAGRWHARPPQDLGDARRRDAHTDTAELADDPLITPPRVLTRKPQHQLTKLLRDRRPARPPPGVRPPFPHKLAMPTQQRVRANEERRPARPAQQPASRGQEHPIRLLQPRPCDLPAQNGQLVPEYDDLKLLELTRTQPQRRHRERTPKQQIHQRDQHQAPSTKIANEKRDSTARRSGQQGPMPVMTGLRTRHAGAHVTLESVDVPGVSVLPTPIRIETVSDRQGGFAFINVPALPIGTCYRTSVSDP